MLSQKLLIWGCFLFFERLLSNGKVKKSKRKKEKKKKKKEKEEEEELLKMILLVMIPKECGPSQGTEVSVFFSLLFFSTFSKNVLKWFKKDHHTR